MSRVLSGVLGQTLIRSPTCACRVMRLAEQQLGLK